MILALLEEIAALKILQSLISLDISTLNNGIYLIKVMDTLGNTETSKFSKLQ